MAAVCSWQAGWGDRQDLEFKISLPPLEFPRTHGYMRAELWFSTVDAQSIAIPYSGM